MSSNYNHNEAYKFVEQLCGMLRFKEDDDDEISDQIIADVMDLIFCALQGDTDLGDISSLIHDRYVVEKIKSGLASEKLQFREEAKEKLNVARVKLDAQFESRVQAAVELQGIYKVIEERFISDPSFLNYALSQIQRDVRESKKNGNYPFLFKMTLDYCDKQQFLNLLIAEHGKELIEEYRQELKEELLKKHRPEILIEIKKELIQDQAVVEGLKNEIRRDLVKKMFG